MGAMSPTHWLIVIAVFVLLFGAKKLPELARSLGQSTRVLKGEMRGLRDDEAARSGELPAAERTDTGGEPTSARTVPTEA